jgi:hypothetical protein
MKQTISFDAVLWDLKKVKNKYSYLIKQYSLGLTIFLLWFVPPFSYIIHTASFYVFLSIVFLSIGLQYWQYKALKQKEAKGEVIFFSKKKNERETYLYSFLLFLLLVFLLNESFFWVTLLGVIAVYYLTKYLFYIPSIAFIVEGYQLTILQGLKHQQIDFTYPTKLRFIYNIISFENHINGKVQWKKTNLDKEKIDTLKHFLGENFGREMIISPSTGQPLT